MKNKIDIVVTWVDEKDEKWLKEKEKYLQIENNNSKIDVRKSRYRDWDNLKYWFRGIEKNVPWVNKIYFVTYGHVPEWLNINNNKLVIVKHEDYIPKEFLPTFNSRCIEMFFNKIPNLSENFIYFNDDMFIINPTSSEDFFKNDLPCDSAILSAIVASKSENFGHTLLCNMEIINKYFNMKESIKNNRFKWFNYRYSYNQIRTFYLKSWNNFPGFKILHLPISYKKSTFDKVWELESDALYNAVKYRFRNLYTVNHWVFQEWQIASGDFFPRSLKFGKLINITSDNYKLASQLILTSNLKTLCLNDYCDLDNFDKVKEEINNALQRKFPDKSSFEI